MITAPINLNQSIGGQHQTKATKNRIDIMTTDTKSIIENINPGQQYIVIDHTPATFYERCIRTSAMLIAAQRHSISVEHAYVTPDSGGVRFAPGKHHSVGEFYASVELYTGLNDIIEGKMPNSAWLEELGEMIGLTRSEICAVFHNILFSQDVAIDLYLPFGGGDAVAWPDIDELWREAFYAAFAMPGAIHNECFFPTGDPIGMGMVEKYIGSRWLHITEVAKTLAEAGTSGVTEEDLPEDNGGFADLIVR